MSAPRQLLRRLLTLILPRHRFLVRGPADVGAVALTFDDGPDPILTPRLLDLLQEHRLRATFFVVGREAAVAPELLHRMIAEGHTIGHHSWTHSEPSETPTQSLLREIAETDALFLRAAGTTSSIVRPPKGKLTWQKTLGLLFAGKRIVLWSVDPKDYAMTTSAPLIKWAESARFRPGDVVLLHDVHPHCLEVIPLVAQRLASLGLAAVPLHEWISSAMPRA